MSKTDPTTITRFDEIQSGDRVEVEHHLTIGSVRRPVTTVGTVVRTERRRHGLHCHRAGDDKVFSDVLLLELPDGELTTIAMDPSTVLRRV